MKISLRILLGYFLIVGLAGYFVLNVVIEEVKPGVRQSMEETLVDTANILAELAAPDLRAGRIAGGDFARAVYAAAERELDAQIWGVKKGVLEYRVYVTDTRGIVQFDSEGQDVGKDYSRWNDVLLTLQGRYGVRSTRADPEDESSSVMHVAAPVRDAGKIIGVLTVAKPNASVQPFIDRSERKIRNRGLLLLGAAAAIGLLFTWWLTRSLGNLRRYARAVSEGRKVPLPESGHSEIAELGRALEAMREKLEGRQYVEHYVHTLTHEVKSPLAAIRGAAELLDEDMPRQARTTFLANIREQCERIGLITEKLLNLAQVEHQQTLQQPGRVDLRALLNELVASLRPRLETANLEIAAAAAEEGACWVRGEAFLLRQAMTNLIDNAIDFSPPGQCIEARISAIAGRFQVYVRDHGPGVPDYALERVFERFYSLARPATGKKSTGLGLPFVREVAVLHSGTVTLTNHPDGGAVATLELPEAA